MFHTDQDDPSSSDDEGMPYTRPAKFKAAHSFKGPFDFDQIKVVQDLSGEHMVPGLFDPFFLFRPLVKPSTRTSERRSSVNVCVCVFCRAPFGP